MRIPVIPKWSCKNVKNWAELISYAPDGKQQIKAATAVLLNYMPLIGITEITTENVRDCWRRIAIREALLGGLVSDGETDGPLFLTRSDIERHIGAETEGETLTFQEFCDVVEKYRLDADEAELPSFVANGNKGFLSPAN